MNSAKLDKSQRLQAVYSVLKSGREYSTMDLIIYTGMCAINSIVSELRDNGKDIKCQRRGGAWYYRLITKTDGAIENTEYLGA